MTESTQCRTCNKELPNFFRFYTEKREHELHQGDMYDEVFGK